MRRTVATRIVATRILAFGLCVIGRGGCGVPARR